MSKPASPKPPSTLGAAGKTLWKSIHRELPSGWGFDEREMAILALACRQADDLARLERAVKRDGTMIKGSAGQPVLNPAIPEARAARAGIERLLRQLEIPAAPAWMQTDTTTQRKAA